MGNKQERELLRMLFEAAPNGIMAIDDAGNIIIANSRCEQMFGYSRDELIGRSVEILLPPRFRQRHVAQRKGFSLSPQPRLMGTGRDLYGLKKDGSEFPVEVGFNYHSTESARIIVATVVDITMRKTTAEEQHLLGLCRERLDLCQQLGIPAAILDCAGGVLFSNALIQNKQSQVLSRDGRIQFRNQGGMRSYTELLGQLEGSGTDDKVHSFPLPAYDGHPPLTCHLLPMRGTFGQTFVMFAVKSITDGSMPPPELVQGLFGLTPAEARIAMLIGAGISPREAAGQLGISEGGLRTTLKQVFDKVCVSRQSELAVLFSRLTLQ